jgi:hypothetical protein
MRQRDALPGLGSPHCYTMSTRLRSNARFGDSGAKQRRESTG